MSTIFEELEKSIFDLSPEELRREERAVGASLSKVNTEFSLKYKTVYVSDSEKLAIVQKVGLNEDVLTVFHVPTVTELGFVFKDLRTARRFVDIIDKEWDWSFSSLQDSTISVEDLNKIAEETGATFLRLN